MDKKLLICSWNLLDSNTHEEDILRFINENPCDVFCLQEVSESVLLSIESITAEDGL